jgi:bifunctional DNA-binding transcriptional regulator/antitoxin component of YhaV-PrlF toxin-antitoxin module
MRLTLSVGDDRRIVIPADALESLHLEPGATVAVEIVPEEREPQTPARLTFDEVTAELEKLRPAFRERMLADGYHSVDEYMNEIRPKW